MVSKGASGDGSFPETRWTLILASQSAPELRRQALAELLQTYWQPLYVYLRRKGLAPEEAADAVQGFAVRLLEKDFLSRLDPKRGRLRGYLKTALNHYVSNLREEANAEKRGGRVKIVSLDFDAAEQAVGAAPPDAEKAYLRGWAERVFERALDTLRSEFTSSGRTGPLDVLVRYFRGEELESYAAVAAQHAMTVPQLKSFLHRARARFRELVVLQVSETVAEPAEVEEEMRELVAAL
jgi:DNA-directed RNA polymerase specialized sigma24 family protein